MATSNRNTNMVGMGLLGAAAAGALIGMLFAPKAGRETRTELSGKMRKGMDKMGTTPEKIVNELNQQIDKFGHDVPEDLIEKMKPFYNQMVNVRDRLIMAINKDEKTEVTEVKQEARKLLSDIKQKSSNHPKQG